MISVIDRFGTWVLIVMFVALLSAVWSCSVFRKYQTEEIDIHDFLGTFIDHETRPAGLVLFSPLIVVATVRHNESIGQIREARRFAGVGVQLRKASVSVELVLRGSELPDDLSIHYFAQAYANNLGGNPLHKSLYRAEVGHRYIFFLLREGSRYRSVGDIGSYTIELLSGRHSLDSMNQAIAGNAPIGNRIAWLLLTLGEGAVVDKFAQHLDAARAVADAVGSRKLTHGLLRGLKGDPRLEAASCFELVRAFYGEDACLTRLQDGQGQPAAVMLMAAERLAGARISEKTLLDSLRSGPGLGFAKMTYPDSYSANRQELELLKEHPDPEVRALATGILNRCYPGSVN